MFANQRDAGKLFRSLTSFARAAVQHGVEGAGIFLGFGVLFGGGGAGSHGAADFFLHADGGFFDVAGLEGA